MDRRFTRRAALRLSAFAALAPAPTGCGGRPAEIPVGADRLMFIRHAEEPGPKDIPSGVTEDGAADDRSLSVRGWVRAGALVGLFDPRDASGNPLPPRAGLIRPAMIFASNPDHGHSRRSLETVTPLASALEIDVRSGFISSQTAELADALQTTTGSVLIAWTHHQIAAVISHFTGVAPSPPASWPDDRYDVVYVLTRSGGGWRFTQVPQMILAGDQAAPIY